jgi:glucose/arabinose dehydrogenase
VHATGAENGLLGLAVRPDDDSTVWAYESTSSGNRVVRMRYANGTIGAPQTILDGIPTAAHHNGGRLVFGPDGDLYVGTGDAEIRSRAQDTGSLGGKILRIKPDGSVPADNPFRGSPVWSYGHRNVQGLAFDSAGRLWATEFGQDTWDELNRIEPGKNYGWPNVEGKSDHPKYVNPLVQWHTDDASCSGLGIDGSKIVIGCLRGERLYVIDARSDGSVGTPRVVFQGTYGRLRAVTTAPDGSVWFSTSNKDGRGTPKPGDDKILAFRPS